MPVLVTSSRIPAAIDLIRKLGRAGHRVLASDTFRASPGSHSNLVEHRYVTASPTFATAQFLDDVERIVRAQHVERIVPAFEEVFYLARHRARFEPWTELFAPDFETLRRLHDKIAFTRLAEELGVRALPTAVATSRDELAAATREVGQRFFARPAYSRGGVTLFTNAGPLAGAVRLEDCAPSPENPFLVQPFLDGVDVCSYGIAHRGRLALHSTYVHPMTIEHAGGIVFESIEDPEALAISRRFCAALGYHGQISLDFRRSEGRLVVLECNPRPTPGLALVPEPMFERAMGVRPPDDTLIAPAGTKRKLSLAILRDMVVSPSHIPEDLDALVHAGEDIYAEPNDVMPLVFQILAYSHVLGYALKTHHARRGDIIRGYLYDVSWDGQPIA